MEDLHPEISLKDALILKQKEEFPALFRGDVEELTKKYRYGESK